MHMVTVQRLPVRQAFLTMVSDEPPAGGRWSIEPNEMHR